MADEKEGAVQSNSTGNPEVPTMFEDAPVVESPPIESDEHGHPVPQKRVPPMPANAEAGPIVRTGGPSAEATLEANVGVGESVNTSGIADGALGQHTKGENEPVDAMVGVVEAAQRGIPGGSHKEGEAAPKASTRSKK